MKNNKKFNQIKLSEKSFKAIAESATDAIIIADAGSNILFSNKKAMELFGYEEKELIGESLTILMPEEYRKAHRLGVKRFLSTGEPKLIGSTIELSAIKKNQTEFPIELSLSAWQEDNNYFFAGIIRDISEKHKILKEVEMLQTISFAISKADTFNNALRLTIKIICQENRWDCGEAWVLSNGKHMIKYAPVWYMSDEKFKPFIEESENLSFKIGEGMVGRVFLNKIERSSDLIDDSNFKRSKIAKQVGLVSGLGVPVISHEGEVFASLMFFFSKPKEEDVVLTRLVASLANQLGTFLEKKQTEEMLKQSRDYYLTILEDFPAMIMITDTEGKPIYYNKTWLKFTGNCSEDELKKEWTDNVRSEDLEQVTNVYDRALKDRNPFEFEYRTKRHDGQYRWILSFGRPFYNIDKKFKGYLGVCYDITEQKENVEELKNTNSELQQTTEKLMTTEELLKELNTELEKKVEGRTKDLKEKNVTLLKINRDLDNFIYTASHDLKAPIANIEGLIRMIHDSVSISPFDKNTILSLVKMISESISKLNKTIADLTEISKVQRMEKDDIAPQNLMEIIEDVKVLLADLINTNNAEIKLELSRCPSIKFSKKDIRSVIYNLLSNAIKFRSPERIPVVTISCYKKNDFAILSVSDNGIGIDLKKVKLFKMFKRYSTQAEGTGIGLYIIKRIIDDAEGKIKVKSEVNKGSTFSVYFKINDN